MKALKIADVVSEAKNKYKANKVRTIKISTQLVDIKIIYLNTQWVSLFLPTSYPGSLLLPPGQEGSSKDPGYEVVFLPGL